MYSVKKLARGGNAQWFVVGVRRFADKADAMEYFHDFIDYQRPVLGNGIRIEFCDGQRRLLVVGGRLDNPCEIRETFASRMTDQHP